jgi:hypothetical protein
LLKLYITKLGNFSSRTSKHTGYHIHNKKKIYIIRACVLRKYLLSNFSEPIDELLNEMPLASNYVFNFNTLNCEIKSNFYYSSLTIKENIIINNITSKCKLILTHKQYKKYKKILNLIRK